MVFAMRSPCRCMIRGARARVKLSASLFLAASCASFDTLRASGVLQEAVTVDMVQ